MSTSTFVPSQALMTFLLVLAIVLVAFLYFMRKRSNRHPMEDQKERNIDEIRRGVPPEQ